MQQASRGFILRFLRGLSSAPGEITENRTGTVFEMLKKGFGPTAPSAVIAG
ncbi:hypothetical protein [Ralstonia syzygii]|uniref:hypothetical protein n=1 Tax=Ralstonia syzygii TaxID=28097 RepID=UPI0018D17B44|nr:hypothetical protein [Ralstonia syzygii]